MRTEAIDSKKEKKKMWQEEKGWRGNRKTATENAINAAISKRKQVKSTNRVCKRCREKSFNKLAGRSFLIGHKNALLENVLYKLNFRLSKLI